MKLGPHQRTPAEMKEQLLQARRAYHDGKRKLAEQSVSTIEGTTNPYLLLPFLGITIAAWSFAAFSEIGFARLYEAYGLYPFAIVFAVSYFTFYLASKLVLRPSAEEIADDTSYFSLFSASSRKEKRSWISIGLATIHTLVLFLFW